MNRTVEKGKTLLIEGPASVTVTTGKACVFGLLAGNTSRIVIREGKRLPFSVEEKATFDIALGATANIEENEMDTIPQSWCSAFNELDKVGTKPVVVIILGAADSGKSSFSTYLINRILQGKKRTAILDGDLGQSDVGPPCTVAYTFVSRPITDLFNLTAKNAFFVGVTSPGIVIEKILDGLGKLYEEILKAGADFVIVNTDGWVEGELAAQYKTQLVKKLNPNVVFFVEQKEELKPIIDCLEKFKLVQVESPAAISQRSREKRKNLRELGYVKYLRNSKVQSLPLNWLKIEEDQLFGLAKKTENARRLRKIDELLGMKPLNILELRDRVNVIIGKNRWIEGENIKKVEDFTKKKVYIIRKGEEEGLLTGLYDNQRKFLGIGILQEIDFLKRVIKISTPVSGEIATVVLGKVKLDKNLKELPTFSDETLPEAKSFEELT